MLYIFLGTQLTRFTLRRLSTMHFDSLLSHKINWLILVITAMKFILHCILADSFTIIIFNKNSWFTGSGNIFPSAQKSSQQPGWFTSKVTMYHLTALYHSPVKLWIPHTHFSPALNQSGENHLNMNERREPFDSVLCYENACLSARWSRKQP